MKVSEFEVLLKELEVRLEHLKALYEQWFQGIERLPPVRRRESLERALKELRRDQPNNTAMRFRFQTVWQRWITMTTHWDRVTRQIEEGTYRRDVLRARRRNADRDQAAAAGRVSIEVDVEMDLDDFDFDAEVGAAIAALEDKTEPEIQLPAAAAASPPSVGGLATFARPKEMTFRRPVASSPPSAPTPPSARDALSAAQGALPAPAAAPRPPATTNGAAVGMPAPRPAPAAPSPTAARPAPAGAPRPPTPAAPTPAAPSPIAARPPGPAVPSPSAARPGGAPARPPAASAPSSVARAAAPAPARTAGPPAARGPSPGGLGESELRRIHAQYVDASRRAGASDMSYEKLAQRIKTMEPELKKKHGGKAIDFEVVVKDGRVGLKPVLKG